MAKAAPPTSTKVIDSKKLLIVAILILAMYVIVPKIGEFRLSLTALRHGDMGWVGIGLLATALSYGLAALTYRLLALRPLRYLPTLLVQIASMFTNRLLPAGAGAIGINYAYLRRQKHAPAQAASVVGANNLLGLLGHLSVLLLILALYPGRLLPLHHPTAQQTSVAMGVLLVISITVVLVMVGRRSRLRSFMAQTVSAMTSYAKRPGRLVAALASSVLLTACYAVTLYAAAKAVDISLPMRELFIILTLGVAGATVVPTPGGVGGAEASLVAGFSLYGVDASSALAAALLYRLCTYWLPFVIGIGGFVMVRRRYI